MTAYKVLAEALDDVAARLADAAAELRDLEHDDDAERARTLARERTRRYRARRRGDVTPRHGDVTVTREESTNSTAGGPSRPTDRQGGRVGRDDGGPVTASRGDVTDRDARDRDARDRLDDNPASPWSIPAIDDDARALGQQRIRELREQLHDRRGGP